jgi:hypothetical protein
MLEVVRVSPRLNYTCMPCSFLVASSVPVKGLLAALGLDLVEVLSFGSSLVYGRNSGAPGMYLRRGSGTTNPYLLSV